MPGEAVTTWVYAVTPEDTTPPSGVGVDDGPLRRVAHAGLAAVVSSVALSDPDEVDRRLRQPAELEALARTHHQVVTSCFEAGPTVPFRLATLYRGDDGVRRLLAERREELSAALATVAGRAEWGVQAYAVAAAPPPAEEPDPAAGPGTAYLLRQRGRRLAQQAAERAACEAAERIDRALAEVAVAVRPQSTGGGARQAGTLVLNTSYLVDEREQETFRATVEDLARRHAEVRVRLTGPWPAYSFVGIGRDE